MARCSAKTTRGTQCRKAAKTGHDVCNLHTLDHDTVGIAENASAVAQELWARVKRAEARYPIKTWEHTIRWLNGEIVLAREAVDKMDPGDQLKHIAVVQKWAKLLIEALKNFDEREKGAIEVVFNLEHRPAQTTH